MAASEEKYRRPNGFEMYAMDRLLPMLRPALKHVLAVIAERHTALIPLFNQADNVIAGTLVLIDLHHLNSFGSTFAEHFYGLQRASKFGRRADPLPRRAVLSSLLLSVILPILKDRLDDAYHAATDNTAGAALRAQLRERAARDREQQQAQEGAVQQAGIQQQLDRTLGSLKQLFLRIYPMLHMLWEAATLIYTLRYMFGRSKHYSFLLHLQGLVIQRTLPSDQQGPTNLMNRIDDEITLQRASTMSRVQSGATEALAFGVESAKYALLVSVFGFRFLDWWYTNDVGASASSSTPVVPAPPGRPVAHADGLKLPADPAICPLCNDKRQNPAITPSGFMFCLACIFGYVEDHGRCPVTFTPVTTNSIRKIFETDR